jgi:hypothetical protein
MGEEFSELFRPGRSRAGYEALAMIERRLTPKDVGFVWRCLVDVYLRVPVAKAISRCREGEFMRAWIVDSPPETAPGVRWGLRQIRRLAWLEGGVEPLLELPAESLGKALRLLEHTSLPAAQRYEMLWKIVVGPHNPAQVIALQGMVELDTARLDCDLRMIASWGDPVLSPRAREALEARRNREAARCREGEPEQSRAPQTPFEWYWKRFATADERTRYHEGERILNDRSGVLAGLTARCNSVAARERLQAVEMIRYLELVDAMSLVLARLARDPDARVRSAAIVALGQVSQRVHRRIYLEAIHDGDARVRANALEALEVGGAKDIAECARSLLGDHDHRVRANAVRALLRQGDREAGQMLIRLLDTGNRAERISGLWVIGQMGLVSLRDHVRRLSEEDGDPVVRRRALDTLAVLEVELERPRLQEVLR